MLVLYEAKLFHIKVPTCAARQRSSQARERWTESAARRWLVCVGTSSGSASQKSGASAATTSMYLRARGSSLPQRLRHRYPRVLEAPSAPKCALPAQPAPNQV